MDHRFAAICTLTIGFVVGAGATIAPQQVLAQIDRSDQRCFSVDGNAGDAAIVNLTPILASEPGNGQLISSDVRADPPIASNTNFGPGTVDPNAAVTPIGNDGQVCFQNSVHSPVDLVADHLGTIASSAYTPAQASGAPSRPVDTRSNVGGGLIPPSGQLCFTVNGNPGDAAIVNLTPVLAGAPGDGQLISSDVKANPPVASNTNFGPGTVDPNVAVTRIGADGQVCFQNSVHGSVHLVADHLGTISASAYTPAQSSGAPSRRVDTRSNLGGGVIAPSGQLCFGVNGSPGDAAIVNLTPILAGGGGDGQLISSDVKANPPVASNTNFRSGSVDPNVAVTRIGADGQVCFQNSVHTSIHLVADHLGSITASAYTPATPSGAPDRKLDTRVDAEPKVVRPQCEMPSASSYSTSTAHTMFGLSSRAYEVEPGIAVRGSLLDDIGSATVHFRDRMECWELLAALRGGHAGLGAVTDTEVFVARNVDTDDLVVSFRGTELNPVDIITDASVTRIPWTVAGRGTYPSAVHVGFAAAYLAVRDQLVQVLRDEQLSDGDGTRVYFTGHSLGGALATIASIDLVDDVIAMGYTRSETITYTFGAPRSMSEQMSNLHASLVPNTYAVVNPNDPVAHLPTAIGSNPYSHVRNMAVLHAEDGTRTVRRNFGDGRDYGGCPHLVPDLLPIGELGDHGRQEYHRRVGATAYLGAPSVSLTVYDDPIPFAIDNLRMHWDAGIEGPCDQVAIWNRSSRPTSISGALRDRWAILDTNDQHSTTVNVGDANWIGYIDMFGEVISAREY